MIQIVVVSTGINIGRIHYPCNSLIFTDEGQNIKIMDLSGNVIFDTPFTNFMNASDEPYASPQAVIDELRQSYT